MLEKDELGKYGPPGFNLGQKEKDYIQHWILSYLSRSGFGGVFKGGTCLQKAFGLPRYSEDLDFTLGNAKEPDLEGLTAFLSSSGFSFLKSSVENSEVSKAIKIRLRGPLYSGKTLSEATVRLDLSKRENVLLKPNVTLITPPYQDLLPYQILTMDKTEIAAEKIRALMTRKSARDLFDLYFLVRQDITVERKIIDIKLDIYKINFDYVELKGRIEKIENIWRTEISSLTSNYLEFEVVAKEVLNNLKKL